MYRPPLYVNLLTFLKEITLSINKDALKYENFIIIGDFNIDINSSCIEKNNHRVSEAVPSITTW